jgi:hypothetical protein
MLHTARTIALIMQSICLAGRIFTVRFAYLGLDSATSGSTVRVRSPYGMKQVLFLLPEYLILTIYSRRHAVRSSTCSSAEGS